jgi:hypothetical protein
LVAGVEILSSEGASVAVGVVALSRADVLGWDDAVCSADVLFMVAGGVVVVRWLVELVGPWVVGKGLVAWTLVGV